MTTTETPAITYAVGDRVMVNYSKPGRPAHSAWSGPATVNIPQRTPGSLVVVKTDTGFTGAFRPDAVSPLYTSTTAEDFEGIDALPVGIVVQDRDGDIFQRADDGRFVLIDGSESSFNFQPGQYDAFPEEISQVPLTVLNPELLDELLLGDYRVGDRVRIASDIFCHRVPVGTPGTVLGSEVDVFVEVRFDTDDLRTYPCALNEIEPYTEVEVDPCVRLADLDTEPPVVPDAELIGATVEDVNVLDSLPNGTVLRRVNVFSEDTLRVKINDTWTYVQATFGTDATQATKLALTCRALVVEYLPAA